MPKVNRQLAEKLLEDSSNPKKKRKRQQGNTTAEDGEEVGGGDGSRGEVDVTNPLGDQRFAAMFKNTDFEVDPESEAFQRLHPILSHKEKKQNKKKKVVVANKPDEEEEEVGMQC